MVTFCLLNWKRPESLRKLVELLDSQTVRPSIFLHSNGVKPPDKINVDLLSISEQNEYLRPRWEMMRKAKTEYVATMDDDLHPADLHFVSDLCDHLRANPLSMFTIMCAYGVILNPSKKYMGCKHVGPDDPPAFVHVAKGRLMIMRTATVMEMPVPCGLDDDIEISANMGGERRIHWKSGFFRKRLKSFNLPHGLNAGKGWASFRETARRHYFPEN